MTLSQTRLNIGPQTNANYLQARTLGTGGHKQRESAFSCYQAKDLYSIHIPARYPKDYHSLLQIPRPNATEEQPDRYCPDDSSDSHFINELIRSTCS